MCDIIFENAKSHRRTVNRMNVYAEAVVRKVLRKICYEKFCRIHKKTSVPESLLWCFISNFAKFVRTNFL